MKTFEIITILIILKTSTSTTLYPITAMSGKKLIELYREVLKYYFKKFKTLPKMGNKK